MSRCDACRKHRLRRRAVVASPLARAGPARRRPARSRRRCSAANIWRAPATASPVTPRRAAHRIAGGLRLDTPFGYMLAPNITPDPETGIGRWSSADFYRALHDGVNKRGQDMYPTMPYDFYTKVTRDGHRRHLRVPAHGEARAQRRGRQSSRTFRSTSAGRWPSGASSTSARARTSRTRPGRRRGIAAPTWSKGLGHCSDCHSPRNLLGGIEKSKDFNGAVIDGWFALDLTSDIATGLGAGRSTRSRRTSRPASYKGKTTTLGPMAEVIRNSLSHLTDADLQGDGRVSEVASRPNRAAHRRARPPIPRARAAPRSTWTIAAVATRRRGRGIPGVFPPLAGNGVVVARRSRQHPQGRRRAAFRRAVASSRCRRSTDQLTDQQVAEIANYIRTSWGNSARSPT